MMTAEELFHSETASTASGTAPVCPVMLREGYVSPRNQCDCPKTRTELGIQECQMPATMECPVRRVLFREGRAS